MKKLSILVTMALMVSILGMLGMAEAKEAMPVYSLTVSFDIPNHLLKGNALITFLEDGERTISATHLKIISTIFNGDAFMPQIKEGRFNVTGKGTLEIRYEGIFIGESEERDLENVGVVSENIISDQGISLTLDWYPSFEGMAFRELKAIMPQGFTAISEADEINTMPATEGMMYSFHFPYPLDDINLVAGPYVDQYETHLGIDIHAYFFPEDVSLAQSYLKYAKKYLSLYSEILTPYPFKRFSIVENILSTGYSMPTFTLLGRDVVRLPFIKETSLGHEILHQWFGNWVYVDYEKGNWVEGLTSYLSDHLYEEQKGNGWRHRKKILTDYRSYVTPSKETPLKEFLGRRDFASSAIGYGKGAMFFHMLKELVGEDIFYNALLQLIKEKKNAKASWADIQGSFEKASDRELEWFFQQWLNRNDIPSFKIEDMRVVMLQGVPTISFEVVQEGEPYRLDLPYRVVTERGKIKDSLKIEKVREGFEIAVTERPLRIIFDEDYDIMRRLTDRELPPVIARLVGDEKRLVIIPEEEEQEEGKEKKYGALVDIFKAEGFVAVKEKEVKDEEIQTSSVLVLGYESPVLKRLFGRISQPGPGFSLNVKPNPLNPEKVVAYAHADSKPEIDPVVRRIFRYGKYSFIRFQGGKNMEKETESRERGMGFNLYEPVMGIDPKSTVGLSEIIRDVMDKPIIYVGERHSNYEDHRVQLELIAELYKQGKRFAIGMEMFQAPFQKALDEYISGSINEREFLKASEYFKRWRFDYQLYREIIDFAKAKGIPLVAINIREEITKKVTEGGLDALTDEEKKEIPLDMDMADEDYKEKLRGFFALHKGFNIKNFNNFYQSQILWDETMAHSIAGFKADNKDHQMVVLAGVQHIMFSSGIPQRTKRLNNKAYATLINGEFNEIGTEIGDYLLFPSPMDAPEAPKLGVLLQEKDGKVNIKDLLPGSVALKAGLKKGDTLLFVDEWGIESIQDVKIGLFDKRHGETIRVEVLRQRFLLGQKAVKLDVTL